MRKRLLEQRWPWLVAAGLSLVGFLATFIEIERPGDWDRRPRGSVEDIAGLRDRGDLNVLFILVDTLRAEHLGSYGYERDTSPVLDRLAHSGAGNERLKGSFWGFLRVSRRCSPKRNFLSLLLDNLTGWQSRCTRPLDQAEPPKNLQLRIFAQRAYAC